MLKVKVKQLNKETMEIEIVETTLEVGDGVTLNYYSDRQAATIIEIGPNGKWLKVQEDNAERTDNNGMSECQDYVFSRNEKGRIHIFKKTRYKPITLYTNTGKSTYNQYGIYLTLKKRNQYFDYSF